MEQNNSSLSDQVNIVYFTDPLCCWSWALEPHLQRLIGKYKEAVTCKYVMSGLIPDWKHYSDPVNDISRPAQMAPFWMQVSRVAGVPLNEEVWHTDPPASSYPACIAVKCAENQSGEAAYHLLRALREAVMVKGHNISRQSELEAVAEQVQKAVDPSFDSEQFRKDLREGKGMEAFKEDLLQKEINQIGRLPALIFKKSEGKGVILFGYRPFDVLEEVFLHVKNDL